MSIVQFLLARIAEDEAGALDAGGLRWHHRQFHPDIVDAIVDENGWGIVPTDAVTTPEFADHIARHDPARALAECEAKRRIVQRHLDNRMVPDAEFETGIAMQALASVYADHPDFDEAWRG